MAEKLNPISSSTSKRGVSNKSKVTRLSSLSDLSDFTFDKVQPQVRELEEAVLGGMMLDKEAATEVIDILKPESFYVEAHQHIFEAMHNLFGRSQPIDILTVAEQLRKMGKLEDIGGAFYLTQLTNKIGSTANIEYHARIISEKYILRELIRTSNMVIKNAYDETTDVFDLLDEAESNLFEITEQNLRRSYSSMSNLVQEALKQISILQQQDDALVGIPSGFTELDRMTSGWQKSDLVILAARPGMGKTAFALSLARNAAKYNYPIAVFSLEMSCLQLTNRMISAESGIPAEKLKKGDLHDHEWMELNAKVEALAEAPIFIDDTPALNIFELRAKCRRLKMQHKIEMIIIDYLQLMSGAGEKKAGNREQEISMISRSLKSIAKELDVPIIALSQLSRAVETRGGEKRPQLSDLRESGSIEQDADMVLFLYRPEYYGFDQDVEGISTKGVAEILISKHRNGALGTVKVKFIDKNAAFADLEVFDEDLQEGGLIPNEFITIASKMNNGSKPTDTGFSDDGGLIKEKENDEGDEVPF